MYYTRNTIENRGSFPPPRMQHAPGMVSDVVDIRPTRSGYTGVLQYPSLIFFTEGFFRVTLFVVHDTKGMLGSSRDFIQTQTFSQPTYCSASCGHFTVTPHWHSDALNLPINPSLLAQSLRLMPDVLSKFDT